MKRNHIALIIVIAVAIGAIISTMADASTYVGFAQAEQNPGTQYTVIGYLDTTRTMNYNPQANRFTFSAVDKNGELRQVVYFEPKPQDFERSEEITMKGHATDTGFVASEILMKCPSKYNEQNQMAGYNTYNNSLEAQ